MTTNGAMLMDAVEEVQSTEVEKGIHAKLIAFDEAIAEHDFLEIDGDIEADSPDEHLIKIINHNTEEAHSVTVDSVVRQNLDTIIRALETGVTTRLFGITRIVGYYSRVHNWNRSKKSELADRHEGSYKLSECNGL